MLRTEGIGTELFNFFVLVILNFLEILPGTLVSKDAFLLTWEHIDCLVYLGWLLKVFLKVLCTFEVDVQI